MSIALAEGEELVDHPDELWYRQVYPDPAFDQDTVGPSGFRLLKSDKGCMSGARSSKQSPSGAYEEHVARGRSSKGTWALSVEEIGDFADKIAPAAHGVRCVDDSAIPTVPPRPTGHTYVDFRTVDEKTFKDIRLLMVDAANKRGRLHPLGNPRDDAGTGPADPAPTESSAPDDTETNATGSPPPPVDPAPLTFDNIPGLSPIERALYKSVIAVDDLRTMTLGSVTVNGVRLPPIVDGRVRR